MDRYDGEALHKVNSAAQGEGLYAYIRVHQWFNKTTELGKMNRVIDIMRPEACKQEHEIAAAVERWERNYQRIVDEDSAELLPEIYRMTAIKSLLDKSLLQGSVSGGVKVRSGVCALQERFTTVIYFLQIDA